MTTYRNIHGRSIRAVTTDPTAEVTEGEIWYNTGSDTFKSILSVEAWSSSGALNFSRPGGGQAGAGTQTVGLVFGGNGPTGPTTSSEEYDGVGFVSGGNLNTGRYMLGGAGTQTAALGFGGEPPPSGVDNSEEYNGSSWTEGNNLNTARRTLGGSGTQTAAMGVGGTTGTVLTASEKYDGTSWTSTPSLNQAKRNTQNVGPSAAALNFGGYTTPPTVVRTETESWDGSSWTAVNTMNVGRYGAGATGTQTSAIAFGGFNPGNPTNPVAANESWDGTSWTNTSISLAQARGYGAGFGTNTAAVLAGGNPTPANKPSATEEFTNSINIITPSAWASGGNMPVAKRVGACSKGGDINSSLTFGGDTLPMGAGQPQVNTTEEYNGTSWTGGGNVGNNISGSAGAGTQTAMIGATGYSFPTPWGTAGASYIANAFEYDGSSWTNVTAYPTTAVGLISFGTQTASAFGGGAQGGSPGPEANQKSKDYKEYDGSSWTTGGATNAFHSRTQASAGTQTAGIVYAGIDSPGGNPSGKGDTVEEYNGTAWTSVLTAPKENSLGGGFGTQTAFLVTNGSDAPIPSSPGTTGYSFTTLVYDGTTMRTDANTATRRVYLGADGSIGTAAGMVCGGSTSYSSRTTATEEYSQGSTALNVKTLTQS